MVYDVGSAIYEKNRLSNISYMVIEYGLDNIDNVSENELIELALRNTNKLSKEIKGIIGNMFGFNLIEANSEYKGTIIDGNKKIERIK